MLPGTGTPDTGESCFFNYFVFYISEVSWARLNPHCSNAPLCFIQGTCTTSFASDLISFFFFFALPQTNCQSRTHTHNLRTVHTPAKVNSTFKFHKVKLILLLCFDGRGLIKNPTLTDYWRSHFLNKKKKALRPCLVLTCPMAPWGDATVEPALYVMLHSLERCYEVFVRVMHAIIRGVYQTKCVCGCACVFVGVGDRRTHWQRLSPINNRGFSKMLYPRLNQMFQPCIKGITSLCLLVCTLWVNV